MIAVIDELANADIVYGSETIFALLERMCHSVTASEKTPDEQYGKDKQYKPFHGSRLSVQIPCEASPTTQTKPILRDSSRAGKVCQ